MSRHKYKIKRNPHEEFYLYQVQLRIQTLRAKLELGSDRIVKFDQLVRAKKEIEDFERFLNFHGLKVNWMDLI